ncbi:MAG: hypothetical protein PHW69_04545 [Elusimicrobiaceae bacterium]|nr:hypothetical protein [Elusimicrobiaceae bacterium]
MVSEKFRAWVREHSYPLGTVILVYLFFVFLELLRPYYFLEGENRAVFLPNMVFAFDSLMKGQLPFINYHQFMGTPFLVAGIWGALYPLTYISVFLSLFVTGGYFASVDIYMVLHLLIGALGMFYFLKRICRLPDYTAFFGATAWPITGFAVFLGCSWGWQFAAAAAWFPWLLFTAGRLVDKPSYGNMAWLLAARVFFAYSGSAIFVLYAVFAEALFTLLYLNRADIRVSPSLFKAGRWYYFISLGFTAALALPLWLPLLQYSMQTVEQTVVSYELFAEGANNPLLWLWGLLFPFSSDVFKSGIMERALRMFTNQPGSFYYLLPFFCFAGYGVIIGLVGLARDMDRTKHEVWLRPVLIAAGVMLLLSFGVIDRILYYLPFLKNAHHGFKLLLFADAFIIAAASLGMLHLARRVSYRFGQIEMRRVVFYAVALNLGISFIIFSGLPSRTFFPCSEDLPLFEPLKNKLTEGRFVAFAYPASIADGYTQHLAGFDYATLWGLNNVSGSIASTPGYMAALPWFGESGMVFNRYFPVDEVLRSFRRAGVRWFIVNQPDVDWYAEILGADGIVERYSDGRRVIYEVSGSMPMAFAETGGPGAIRLDPKIAGVAEVLPLASEFSPAGVKVRAELSAPAVVSVNVPNLPGYRPFIDGKPCSLKAGPGHFPAVSAPAGKHEIFFKYTEPWFWRGLLVALAGLAGLLALSAERFAIRPLRERFNMRRFARSQEFGAAGGGGGAPRRRNFNRKPFFKRRRKN